jgi:hypothetical protein
LKDQQKKLEEAKKIAAQKGPLSTVSLFFNSFSIKFSLLSLAGLMKK